MKKVLSLVLVLALVLGSFSMAFAADNNGGLSDIADSPNANAITVVNDLGIVTGYTDGTFKGLNNVTRAEFAAMIVRALAIPESALNGFTTTSFTDTEGYGWAVPYLAYCASKGIMTGYGDGTVRPGATITVNEAITMVCRALGYTAEAKELVGSWPANYIALAQSLELYDDMSAVGVINRENAAQLIFNALTEDLVYIDADGATQTVSGKDTMLQLLGGEQALVGGEDEFVLTSGMADSAIINVNEFVGAYVKAFVNKDGDIIAIEVLSTFLDGEFDGTKTFTADDVEYTIDSTFMSSTPAPTIAKIENGKNNGDYNPASDPKEGVIAAKVSGKTIKEIYSVSYWTANSEFQFEEDMLDTKDCKLNDIEFAKNNDNEIDTNSFALLGVAKLADIDVDDVVTVYTSGDKITKVEVGQKTVAGKVTKVSGKNYFIDGVKYKKTDNATDAINLADEGTAFLAYNGKIAFWDKDVASKGNYAIYLGQDVKTDFTDTTVKVKLFTKDGEEITPVLKTSDATTTGITVGDIVTYSLNKAGKVDALDKETDSYASVTGKVNEKCTRIGTTAVKDSVVVFVYDNDEEEWTLSSLAKFDKDLLFGTDISDYYVVLDDGKVDAIAVDYAEIYGAEATYGVINTTNSAVDNDGDKYLHVEGFIDGKELVAFTDKATTFDGYDGFVNATSETAMANLVKISVDADGIVTKIEANGLTGVQAVKTSNEISKVDASKSEITVSGGAVYGLTDDVVIYYWDDEEKEYVVKTSLSFLKGKWLKLYQTDEDYDGFDIVIALDDDISL